MPLDPSYPCDRLRFMLEDSQVLGVADAGEVGRKIAECGGEEVRAAGIARAEQNSKSQSNCGLSGQRLGDYCPRGENPICN